VASAELQALAGWESFYVIVGSSSAALTGLNFVVIAVGAESRTTGAPADLSAFGTPTIIHFCAALLLSAILSAPWRSPWSVAASLAASAAAGLMYLGRIVLIARRGTTYKPVFEDFLWHFALPIVAYTSLFVASTVFTTHTESALFGIAVVALLLMFIGIHNAWDTATWMAFPARREEETAKTRPTPAPPNSRGTSSSRTGSEAAGRGSGNRPRHGKQ
jgi:glucan phosphoethanolaminetransferase (alkaline phosphatase superfamily)